MTPQNLSGNQIIVWAALALGLLVALVLGNAIGTSDVKLVAVVIALIPLAIFLARLKTSIWILIPIGWYLNGRLGFLPLPLTVKDMLLGVSIGAYVLFLALRVFPAKRQRTVLDYLIYANLSYLAIVYARNPAGLYSFGAEIVGGRPYFEVVMAFFAYLVLSRITPSIYVARIFPLFSLLPVTAVAILDGIGRAFPSMAPAISYAYSGAESASAAISGAEETAINRVPSFQFVAQSGGLAACSYCRPITLVNPLYPLRVLALILVFAAIFLSGHRIALLDFAAFFVLGTLLRGTIRDLWIGGALAVMAVLVAVSLHGTLLQLPLSAQRALSVIPGDWDPEAVADAQDTSRWRMEMWKWAWDDSRILRNKVWGQGFGVSADDLNILANKLISGSGSEGAFVGGSQQEWFLLYGGFHNGPLSTIRCVGGVGLILFLPLMFLLSLRGWQLSKKAVNTSACGLVLFVAMPLIYEPIKFLLIFGGFETALPNALFGAGLLNMASNYLGSLRHVTAAKLGSVDRGRRGSAVSGVRS